jgi:hypothetical protein
MGNVTWGLSSALIQAIQIHRSYSVAIETGTFRGDSAIILHRHCGSVFTIESNYELFENSRIRLADMPDIHVLFGYSPGVLPRILKGLQSPAIFWLDAHWFPGVPDSNSSQCPLLEELSIIAGWPHVTQSCVLIDDAHMFKEPPNAGYRPNDWPSLHQVQSFATFSSSTELDIIDDVIIAAPKELTKALINDLRKD